MNPMRLPVRLALLLLALAAPGRMALAEDTGLAVPDSEAADPPTQGRLDQVEGVAATAGWLAVSPALRSAALRAYGQERLQAADAWYHAYEWATLFSEPEDRFIGGWIDAMVAAHLNYPAVAGSYNPTDQPIGKNLSPETQDWLLSNRAFSAEFFSILKTVDDVPRVFAVLEELHRRDPEKFARYSSLALAISVVYDVPPPDYWPHHQVSVEALSRKLQDPAAPFDYLTREDMLGHTYFSLTQLPAEELKFVVDMAAPVSELEWSLKAVSLPLDQLEGAYTMVKYRMDRSAKEEQMVWTGKPYTLQAILEDGGICIDQAYFASEVGKARGVPTLMFMGAGQDGRHAWFGFLDSGRKWRLDVGRYAEQRLVTGVAFDPQTWESISDHELQFLSEGFRALPSFMESRVHEEFAQEFLQSGDAASAARSARMAVNFERRNLPAWETLVAADAKLNIGAAQEEGVMREAALALAKYPDLMITYENRVCASLRARGETSLADYEERGIAERLKGDRADLAVQQASSILSRSIATQPVPEQIATYNAILAQFAHGAGAIFFDEIVTAFAEHLGQVNMRPQARDAVERAREALDVQPGSQISTDMDRLLATLQDQ
jgi:hypothetical protein